MIDCKLIIHNKRGTGEVSDNYLFFYEEGGFMKILKITGMKDVKDDSL